MKTWKIHFYIQHWQHDNFLCDGLYLFIRSLWERCAVKVSRQNSYARSSDPRDRDWELNWNVGCARNSNESMPPLMLTHYSHVYTSPEVSTHMSSIAWIEVCGAEWAQDFIHDQPTFAPTINVCSQVFCMAGSGWNKSHCVARFAPALAGLGERHSMWLPIGILQQIEHTVRDDNRVHEGRALNEQRMAYNTYVVFVVHIMRHYFRRSFRCARAGEFVWAFRTHINIKPTLSAYCCRRRRRRWRRHRRRVVVVDAALNEQPNKALSWTHENQRGQNILFSSRQASGLFTEFPHDILA